MSDKILPSKKIFSIKDARELSKKRLSQNWYLILSMVHLEMKN